MGKHSNRNIRTPGFSPTANPDYARAMAGLRGSSAASRHTPKPRKGTRRTQQLAAIRDQLP